jgi:hypothetical protein
MPADLAPPLALLLHEGGWDEVLMVAAALGIAYLVIVWTGRRNPDGDEELEAEDTPESDPPAPTPDPPPRHGS